MSNLTNYHSHTSYCDGHAPMGEFIEEAIRQGFTSYGISSHAPLPFPTRWTMEKTDMSAYLADFAALKSKHQHQIEMYVGLEIDYLDKDSNPATDYFQQLPLDYRIGSVHLLTDEAGEVVDVDCNVDKFKEKLANHFHNDLKSVVLAYYHKTMLMVEQGGFDIIGHMDKIAFNASACQPDVMQQAWYKESVNDLLNLIAQKGTMVEINSKAYHKLGVFYPNEKKFALLKERNIPVLVNSDSHYPMLVNDGRKEALEALKHSGIKSVMELHKGCWEEAGIG